MHSFLLGSHGELLRNMPWVAAYARWLPRMPKVAGSTLGWGCTDLYYEWGAQGVLTMRVGGATSQLDLASLTPLSVAGCGRLQEGVPHWATSVDYCKQLIIDPTFCGSRFSTGRLLAIEDFTFTLYLRWKCTTNVPQMYHKLMWTRPGCIFQMHWASEVYSACPLARFWNLKYTT